MSVVRSCALVFLVVAVSTVHADDKPAKPVERKIDFGVEETRREHGTVLAVTKDSLLLAQTGKPIITLPAHDCLAAGKVHKLVFHSNSYLLSDLKPGDYVALDTYVENKQTYCVAIQIFERPGGR